MALVHQPLGHHSTSHVTQCATFPATTISLDTKPRPLPIGYPGIQHAELAWDGSNLTKESQYIYQLSNADMKDIRMGLESFKSYGVDGNLVNTTNFPLGQLGNKLRDICHEVHNGKGFCVIRGLGRVKYTVEDSMTIFLGIQSYIAEQRARQDTKGNMVVHIISDPPSATFSPSKLTRAVHARYSTSSLTFHTEETGDIIAWQTRGTAASGGKCIISSAYTIYNALAATRPDIIATLSRPDWPFALPYFHYRPILYYHDSHLIINFGRASLLGNAAHPRSADLPSLNAGQREALDAVEAIAIENQFEFATQPGDIHFINNLAVLHRREKFMDSEASGKKRHLVRMRLRNASEGWSIPAELKAFWDEAFGPEGDMVWHIEPMPEGFFPLRMFPN